MKSFRRKAAVRFAYSAICLFGTLLPWNAVSAVAAEQSLWSQPSLFGAPSGMKDALQEAGIDLSVTYTAFYQGLVGGEGDKGWEFGGKTDVIGVFSGEKLGLWKGFYVNAHAEYVNGNNVLNAGDGSILPVNTALAFPTLGGQNDDFSLFVTQVFSPSLSLSAGKFNMLDAAAKTPLIGGGGLTTFFNTALAAPVSGVTPAYLLGSILSYKTDPAIYTLMIYDPRNAQDEDVITHPFEKGVTTSLAVSIPVEIGGKHGFQNFRGAYSTLDGLDFRDIPDLILPGGDGEVEKIDGYWFASYSFQQYLVEDQSNPGRGWGLFGQVAVSDGNPNPFGWSGFIGLGGTGLSVERPDDRFGIAYFYQGFSENLKQSLEELNVDLKDESGIEAYYNMAVTPWLNVTADGQMIWPGDGDQTAYFLGLRAQLKVF